MYQKSSKPRVRPGRSGQSGRIVLLALLTIAVAACWDPLGPNREALEEAEAVWEAEAAAHYSFTFREQCFCVIRPVRVEVLDGDVVSVELLEPEDSIPGDEPEAFTVEELFERIRAELDRKPYEAKTEFDPTLGHPTDVFFDYEWNVDDEEWGFVVEDLTTLP